MKKLLTIVLMAFALSTFAAEPAAPQKMMLAKKKDHSKDAKPKQAPSKSTEKSKTSKK